MITALDGENGENGEKAFAKAIHQRRINVVRSGICTVLILPDIGPEVWTKR